MRSTFCLVVTQSRSNLLHIGHISRNALCRPYLIRLLKLHVQRYSSNLAYSHKIGPSDMRNFENQCAFIRPTHLRMYERVFYSTISKNERIGIIQWKRDTNVTGRDWVKTIRVFLAKMCHELFCIHRRLSSSKYPKESRKLLDNQITCS